MAGKVFELIRPKSLDDTNYEAYEYVIRWIGRDGADYLYIFYDVEIDNRIRNSVINETDSTRIEALVSSETRKITLSADDFTKNDLTVIGELLGNKYVTRLKKDGTVERYAPDQNSFKYRLMDGRFKVEFDLIMSNLTVWK